jgi:lipopolysaccharide transport system permease protein
MLFCLKRVMVKLEQVHEPVSSADYILIESRQGWGNINLRELWAFRDLLWTLMVRDIKSRYRKTAIGPLWFIIGPFVQMVIMSVVFGGLAKLDSEGLPYPLFLYTATLPWALFSGSLDRAKGSLQDFMPYISKIYIPHLMAPLVSVATGLVDWVISFIILIGLMLYYHVYPTLAILTIPLYTLFILVAALGPGLWAAPLAIRYRDVHRLVSYGMTAFYYVTPIIYSSKIIPARLLWLYQLNPMYWVVEGFRWALVGGGHAPEPYMLIPVGVFILILVLGAFIYERASRNIVDVQ